MINMINSTEENNPLPVIKKIRIGNQDYAFPTAEKDSLTLEKDSVLVVKIPTNGNYDMSAMQCLYDDLKAKFPCHSIIMCYNDIEFTAIHDKAYPPERIEINDTSNYY